MNEMEYEDVSKELNQLMKDLINTDWLAKSLSERAKIAVRLSKIRGNFPSTRLEYQADDLLSWIKSRYDRFGVYDTVVKDLDALRKFVKEQWWSSSSQMRTVKRKNVEDIRNAYGNAYPDIFFIAGEILSLIRRYSSNHIVQSKPECGDRVVLTKPYRGYVKGAVATVKAIVDPTCHLVMQVDHRSIDVPIENVKKK